MFTILLIGFSTFLLFVYLRMKYSYWEKRGIKGPTPLPILGTFLAENSLPPFEIEEKFLRDYGPVFGTFIGTQPILNISDPDLIRTILSDLKKFPLTTSINFNDKYLVHSLFLKNGDDWKNARSAQTPYFTSRKMRNLMSHFEKVSLNFLDNLEGKRTKNVHGDVEIKELAKCYAIDIISKILFAIDLDSFKESNSPFVKNASRLAQVNTIQAIMLTFLPQCVSNFLKLNAFNILILNEFGDYFKKLLKERKQGNIRYNDLSEMMQNAVDDGKVLLSEEEIIGNILFNFFAGIEPVANSVLKMFDYLSKYPEVQTQLYKEIVHNFGDEIDYEKLNENEYLDAVIKETLRLGTNSFHMIRTAAEDVNLGDLMIEKGTELRLIVCIPHHSAQCYSNPKIFNPDRFLKHSNESSKALFIPFSSGPKQCLGIRLSYLEMKYLCVRVLQKYELCRSADSNQKCQNIRGFIITESLNVRFKKRF